MGKELLNCDIFAYRFLNILTVLLKGLLVYFKREIK